MSDTRVCRDPELHDLHFCKLKKKGCTTKWPPAAALRLTSATTAALAPT